MSCHFPTRVSSFFSLWPTTLDFMNALPKFPVMKTESGTALEKKLKEVRLIAMIQTSHNLNGTRKQNKKTCAHAKLKFCMCLRVISESVAEWINSC